MDDSVDRQSDAGLVDDGHSESYPDTRPETSKPPTGRRSWSRGRSRRGGRRPKHAVAKGSWTGGVKMLRPLKIRDFSLLWWGLTVSLLGDGVFFVALPLQVLELRNTTTALTLALIAWTLPLVLFIVVGGVLSDRLERRRVLMFANALQGSAILVLGLLSTTGVIELWHIYVLAAVYGIAEALFGPAFGAIVPDIVPRDLLVEANALDNFSRPFALRVAGPALGGVIIAGVGVGGAFIVDALTFVFAGTVFALISRRKLDRDRNLETVMWDEVRAGLQFVRSRTWLWATLLATAVGLLVFYGPWQALVPFLIINRLGDASDLALVFSVGGLGAMASSVFIGTRNLPARFMTAMYFGMAVGTLMLAGFGLATSTWHAVIASFMMQALLTIAIITWNTTMHRYVPGDILGRVSSLDWMVSTSLIPISLAVSAPLSQAIGARGTLVGAGIFGSIAILLFLLIPGVRDLEREDAQQAPVPAEAE